MNKGFETLSAIILAAGMSRRYGPRNKLMESIDGEAMALKAVRPFTQLGLREVVVVLGHEAERVREALQELPARCVVNENYEEGMGSSLAKGMRSLASQGVDGCLVSLADLPGLSPAEVAEVASAFLEAGGSRIVVPRFKGRRGHPVCFPSRCFTRLGALRGDEGAKAIVDADSDRVWLEVNFASCILDKDT